MTALTWDDTGNKHYETGVDRGVLYPISGAGAYDHGYAWNGLTGVTESPSGAEATALYADNTKYLNLVSTEEFGGTITAYTYPDEFGVCDGTAQPETGVSFGQQGRKVFGLCYRTRIGNDVDGVDHGYKIHLVYGALAAPSEKAYSTINDSPEGIEFSWEFSTTPVSVGTIGGVAYKPLSTITIDSTKVDASALATLEAMLYGGVGTDPQLPLPAAVVALFAGTVTTATPTAPTYNDTTHVITIPTVTGVTYYIAGAPVSGTVTIAANTLVTAQPNSGYKFPTPTDNDWLYTYSA